MAIAKAEGRCSSANSTCKGPGAGRAEQSQCGRSVGVYTWGDPRKSQRKPRYGPVWDGGYRCRSLPFLNSSLS